MDQKQRELFQECRNKVNGLIDELVREVLQDFDTYEEAISALNDLIFELYGNVGAVLIEESIKRIQSISLKKSIK